MVVESCRWMIWDLGFGVRSWELGVSFLVGGVSPMS